MKSIRSKIMWLLFSSVLIVSLIVGAIGIALTSNVINDSSRENMRLLCKNNADKIDMTFAKIEESVNTLAHYAESELTDIKLLKNDEFRETFSAEIQKNALHHIENTVGAAAVYLHYDPTYIGKTDGFYYVKYKETDEFQYHPLTEILAYPNDDNEHVGWWYIPTVSGTATWFEAYYDANLGRYIISYVVPIYSNKQLIGVIGADIFTEHIEDLVKEVSIFNSGQAAILKSDGTVLYHPNFERGMKIGEGDPGFEGVIDKLKNNDNTKLIAYSLKGEKKKLTSCKLKNGMLMVCFAPEKEIYHTRNMLELTNVIITGIVVLIALIIAVIVSEKMANPIKKLNEAAKRLSKGEFEFDIKNESYDEIGELTNTFIEVREILSHQINALDKEAHIDGLTAVGNKAAFIDREVEIDNAISEGNIDFTIVVFDVNKLKVANDVFGHMAGDSLLKTVANHLSEAFGVSNVYRLGGDEFVAIILEEGNIDSEQKILSCVSEMKKLSLEAYPECQVSCAYGASRFDKASDKNLADVLSRADKEMYKNKRISKKELSAWQDGFKGIKQLQVEKYCEMLKSLKDTTDDYLYLMNLETGFLRFFGDNNSSFNIADGAEISSSIDKILEYVYIKDHRIVKDAFKAVINRDTEMIDINFRMHNKDNILRWVSCRGNVIKDEMDNHFVLIGRVSSNAVKHLFNPITALFNKTKLRLDFQKNTASKFQCLMLIDIDNLWETNIKYGSVYGEELLRSVAEELEKRFPIDRIYHADKDLFVILLDGDLDCANEVFEELKGTLVGKSTISASVVPNDGSIYIDTENIYDYAVQLLNTSKKDGIGQLAFFSKESLLEKISEVELLKELEVSVNDGCKGFYLVYQPQINAEDYAIISVEALLRYNSKSGTQVYPDRFIPLLEKSGLIHDVGIWVASEALKKCKEWRGKYNPDFKVSVNLSPKQLEDKQIASRIINLLSEYGLPGETLTLEITESAQLDESEEVMAILAEFRQAGIKIAIDDFGTGYSNLGKLKHINANILKVDRVFVQDIKENGYNYNLIYNVLEFAKSNALEVCMEGVETKEELIVLSGLQPHLFQGYLFDRPCSAESIEDKYFKNDSLEYRMRLDHFEKLVREKKHAQITGIETKSLLSGLNIGLWIIRYNVKTGEGELFADEVMRKLLGIDSTATPTECYSLWYNNIKAEYRELIDERVSQTSEGKTVDQLEYAWNHPEYGEIIVRTSGRCTTHNEKIVVYEGFHRIVDNLK